MPKFAFLILFQITATLVFSQNERHIKFLFEDVSEKKRSKFFKKLTTNQEKYWYNRWYKDSTLSSNVTDSEARSYFIDLNNDTFPDKIYESYIGTPSVSISLNYGDSLKLINQEEGSSQFKEIIKKGHSTEIIISQRSMVFCDYVESIYLLKNDSIELIKKRLGECCISQPNKFFKKPRYFKTTITDCALREYAGMGVGKCSYNDREREQDKYDNTIVRFPKETPVTIWGESFNYFGQKWLFVEILLNEKYKLYRVGWMNADDLERSK
jgi:hypothetical protein